MREENVQNRKKIVCAILSLLLPVLLIVPVSPVKAVTLYESDGGTYDVGRR